MARFSRQFGVSIVELGEVAIADNRVTHSPRGQIHHGVADVGELKVEDGGDPAAQGVELARVPYDRRLAPFAVGGISAQPTETELGEGLRVQLRAPVDALVTLKTDQPRVAGAWCS